MSLKDNVDKIDRIYYSDPIYHECDVREAVSDFNFFMKYAHIREGLDENIFVKIFDIMGKYKLKSKFQHEIWTYEEVSKAIFGDFEE